MHLPVRPFVFELNAYEDTSIMKSCQDDRVVNVHPEVTLSGCWDGKIQELTVIAPKMTLCG